MTQLAIVQTAPVFLNKSKTIQLAVAKVEEAASNGANLVVFTEAFIPGYPAWIRVETGIYQRHCMNVY